MIFENNQIYEYKGHSTDEWIISFYYSGEMDCYNQLSDEEFSKMCENNEWFESLYNYMADYQLPCGDLQRLANLGMVLRDGQPQIVILDSGLTQQIYDEYYKR